jgi:hypothetical protein
MGSITFKYMWTFNVFQQSKQPDPINFMLVK